MATERGAVVIDVGSGFTKAGFAGEETPAHIFLSIIGKPKYPAAMLGPRYKDYYVGAEALRMRGVLRISYPLEHGIVKDWDGFTKLVDFAYSCLLYTSPSPRDRG